VQSLDAWSKELRLSYNVLYNRYSKGLRGDELFAALRQPDLLIEHLGRTQTVAAWSEETGIKQDTIYRRHNNGLSGYDLFTTNGSKHMDYAQIKYRGRTQSLLKWARELGITYNTLIDRYKKGLRGDDLFSTKGLVQKTLGQRNKNLITYKGKTQSISKWSVQFGILYNTIYHKHKKGLSAAEIFKQ